MKNTLPTEDENLYSLKWKARNQIEKSGFTLVTCPNCKKKPTVYENDDMGFIMNCECGAMSIYEKF